MPVTLRDVTIVQVENSDILTAARVSVQKFQHINDTFIRNRTFYEKFNSSMIGDIAKLSFKRFLESQGFNVTDWDEVRPNWTTQRKPYDLLVNNKKIEVRSSISQYEDMPDVLNNENIIHPPRVNFKEINVQVFFSDDKLSQLWFCGWATGETLNNENFFTVRYVNRRPIPFYMMPFNHNDAKTISELITFLR